MHTISMLHRRTRLLLGVGAIVLAVSLIGPGSAAAAVPYSTSTPMVLQGLTSADLAANKNGSCSGNFTHVIKNTTGVLGARDFLDAAQRCGLKVILHFSSTIDATHGIVYPSRVAALVNGVKSHPALFGYLSVKEPSWVHISLYEIRSLYRAYRAADPSHPVIALFGDIPHFGQSVNPYTWGMANIVIVDWYPVETGNGGRATTGTTYITSGPTYFKRVRNYVAAATPGVPIWLMVQTHKYLHPTAHKKQRPNWSLMLRQVREAFVYLGAKGIAFHIWSNVNYNIDERRDPTMVYWMNAIATQVQAGTFS